MSCGNIQNYLHVFDDIHFNNFVAKPLNPEPCRSNNKTYYGLIHSRKNFDSEILWELIPHWPFLYYKCINVALFRFTSRKLLLKQKPLLWILWPAAAGRCKQQTEAVNRPNERQAGELGGAAKEIFGGGKKA